MRKFLLAGILVSLGCPAWGQHVDDSVSYTPIPLPNQQASLRSQTEDASMVSQKPAYFFSVSGGTLIGCKCDGEGVSSTFSVINGITIVKKIRTGIGVGFDSYYGWNTLPIFGMVSFDLWGNRNTSALFLQLNYGFAKAWRPESYQEYGFDHEKGGRMLSPQIGYRLKYHDIRLSLMAGVKMQRVFTYYKYPTWLWVNGEYQQGFSTSTMEQNMNRFQLSMSVGWK